MRAIGFRSRGRSGAIAAMGLLGALAAAGCRGDRSDEPPRQFFPDMDDQPKVKAQGRSTFYQEYRQQHTDRLAHEGETYGRSMREPVAGTVAFGFSDRATPVRGAKSPQQWIDVDFTRRAELLQADDDFTLGFRRVLDKNGQPVKNADGTDQVQYLEYIPTMMGDKPLVVDEAFIRLGQKKYNILCIVCHGGTGEGNGLVGQRWSYALPSYHDPKYVHGAEKGQDGYLFHVTRAGVPNPGGPYDLKMPSYATKLTHYESWAVVAYIRSLQESRKGAMTDVPEIEKTKLLKMRDSEAVGAGGAPAGGAK